MRALPSLTKISFKYLYILSDQLLRSRFYILKLDFCRNNYIKNISESKFHTSSLCRKLIDGVQTKSPSESSTTEKPEKKKKEKLTYITLVAPNSHVTVTTLEDAAKLAERRDLKLIKVKDQQTNSGKARPTYQLLTKSQYLQNEKTSKTQENNKSPYKGIKLMTVSSKINDHDINAKINNAIKWLEKQNEVRIAISNDNGEAENIFNKIVEGTKETGKIVQKREKNTEIRFQILPLKKEKSKLSVSPS